MQFYPHSVQCLTITLILYHNICIIKKKSFSNYFNYIGNMPIYTPGKNLKQCREVSFDPSPLDVLVPSVISLMCVLLDFFSVQLHTQTLYAQTIQYCFLVWCLSLRTKKRSYCICHFVFFFLTYVSWKHVSVITQKHT